MNFTELFAKLPTSTLQDWEAAARKQLKGKSLDSIDLSLWEGMQISPYAVGTAASLKGGRAQGWVQFSSFSHSDQLTNVTLLEALDGGAQGLEISFEDFNRISGELSNIRFDFIALKVNGLTPANQSVILDAIPDVQKASASVVVSLSSEVQCADYQVLINSIGHVVFLLSPKLEVGNQESFSAVFDSLNATLSAFDKIAQLNSPSVSLGVEINLSSNYLRNIVFIHATRILFANAYYYFGMKEPLPRPYLFGSISPLAGNVSHEAYLIDATAKAVAGISGGLDALNIESYPNGDAFLAARRARNIQNVLAIEGHLGLPMNAIEGAAFFEKAAKELVLSVWPDF